MYCFSSAAGINSGSVQETFLEAPSARRYGSIYGMENPLKRRRRAGVVDKTINFLEAP
jgi:hypothetical protein